TVTVVTLVLDVSKYPFINRRLPARSVIGVLHTPLEAQVTVAPLAAAVSSTSASDVPRVAPMALFQFAFAAAPALSPAPIDMPLPTKLMLMAPPTLAVVTTSPAVAVWLRDPPVPMIVSVELPVGVFDAMVTSNVALPDPVTEAGVNNHVAFAGSPLTPKFTVPPKPFTAPIVTV